MENRSHALKLISEAVHLDSSGFSQAAFEKYLKSLQVLAGYLNELFESLGFQTMIQNPCEIKRVLCMVHECSDRIAAISDKGPPVKPKSINKSNSEPLVSKSPEVITISEFPGLKKLKNENIMLLKSYQRRLEKANDNRTRTNLKLELERHLAENDILSKKKFNLAVKQLQKERANMMETEMKKLLNNNQPLNEKEREKRDLYTSVLQFTKSETWPCTWKINCWEDSDIDAANRVFQKTIRCSDHPLSQWLIMVQTNIKRDVDTTVKEFITYHDLLPHGLLDSEEKFYSVEELPDKYILHSSAEPRSISKNSLFKLQARLDSISIEIMCTISNVVHIFYLTYKSLLPIDSEEICLSLIESYILKPIWSNLIILYRMVNIYSEYKTLEVMNIYKDPSPKEIGYLNQTIVDSNLHEHCTVLLKSLIDSDSLTEKSKIIVKLLKSLCRTPPTNERNQSNIVGADELMTLLCFIIVKSKLPQLSSECFALEQLFDMKFMFGEEGYALSSFSTALKYIEMKKLIDGQNNESKTGS